MRKGGIAMARETAKSLRNQVMYCVYVRQYGKNGTFREVQDDLDRIRSLGVDVIWLMPVHPVGEQKRCGSLGSPYAVRDYRAINPEFGSMDDFRALTDAIHEKGMRCIIDVVFNHTSPDSVLAQTHPEWFYHRPDGSFGNRIGEWADIIDLDYGQKGLWEEQIQTLKQWARLVDGFRCDVAPLVPLEFWKRARAEMAKVRPDCLWLAESVEAEFIVQNRARGMTCLSDGELYEAFDITYEYDAYHDFIRLLNGECDLDDYLEKLNRQEYLYPDNYVKLRFLENHDRPRAAFCLPDVRIRRNWTAFLYFRKGMTLLYNGQEAECAHRPSLFEADRIDWTGGDSSEFLRNLSRIKRNTILSEGGFTARNGGNGVIVAEYEKDGHRLIGAFGTAGTPAPVRMNVPDGMYRNEIDGGTVRIESGLLSFGGEPVIFQTMA